jgi:hypothetical protein
VIIVFSCTYEFNFEKQTCKVEKFSNILDELTNQLIGGPRQMLVK